MLAQFWGYLYTTKEYSGLGLNVFTLTFLIALLDSGMLVWAAWKQGSKLASPTTVEASAMSVEQKLVYVAFFATGFAYALEIRSLALLPALPLCLVQARIARELFRINKGFTLFQWVIVLLCVVGIVTAWISPWTAPIYGVAAYVQVGFYALQPLKIWQKKKTTGLTWHEPTFALISTSAWSVYALYIDNMLLLSFCAPFCLLTVITCILYLRYPKDIHR